VAGVARISNPLIVDLIIQDISTVVYYFAPPRPQSLIQPVPGISTLPKQDRAHLAGLCINKAACMHLLWLILCCSPISW
jgi:hypothetical protein